MDLSECVCVYIYIYICIGTITCMYAGLNGFVVCIAYIDTFACIHTGLNGSSECACAFTCM
jgi:hypothetical protein